MNIKSVQANLILLITAVIWGGGFVAQRLGMQQMGPYIFNGFRFLIGALTLVPVILVRKKSVVVEKGDSKKILLIGAVAGLFLFFGATFQQLGLVFTTAGKAGFITGLYVVIVPLLGMLWGDRGSLYSWLGAMIAVVGLYFLSASRGLVFAPGDGFVLIGACFWALHVQFIARFSPDVDAFQLSFVQSLFTSLISFGVGIFLEDVVFDQVLSATFPILYGGVIAIGIAYTMQVVGQQYAKPTDAAIILSLESVFAAFWGWLILGELLSSRALLGSGLMLAGMMISQLRGKKIQVVDPY
ncbi:MAG: DMT family transporter [Anaerolineales bacterium]|nr:DMT family transporter [Anaerolineales bacterium]